MFPGPYWGNRYFGERYWGKVGLTALVVISGKVLTFLRQPMRVTMRRKQPVALMRRE
jgi:hypothetical protein